MLIVLLRHGETAYNAQRRYQGKSDIPLSARGTARLRAADFAPDVVFVTALCRTAQTAAAIFRRAGGRGTTCGRWISATSRGNLRRAGRTTRPTARGWLRWRPPARTGGQSGVLRAGLPRLSGWSMRRWRGAERLVVVAHGGTQMAALSRFAEPHRDYYDGTRRLRAASCWMRRSGRSGGCCAW
ncbi:MAG: phosphoglycerate mutase family protein [Christensenellales bacterium]